MPTLDKRVNTVAFEWQCYIVGREHKFGWTVCRLCPIDLPTSVDLASWSSDLILGKNNELDESDSHSREFCFRTSERIKHLPEELMLTGCTQRAIGRVTATNSYEKPKF